MSTSFLETIVHDFHLIRELLKLSLKLLVLWLREKLGCIRTDLLMLLT
jgi:hypothetical protein